MKYDYIVIGQGIAGSCLAFELLKRDRSILLFDQPDENISSRIAPGIFNPVTGKNLVLTWKAHVLFDYFHEFYVEFEKSVRKKILYNKNIYRPFLTIHEQNDWMGKSTSSNYLPFVQDIHPPKFYDQYIHDPLGGVEIKHSGYIDIQMFLDCIKEILIAKEAYIEEHFEVDLLQAQNSQLYYKNLETKNLIFCDGPNNHENKYFSHLPFSMIKGELLTIETSIKLPVIFNRGVFVHPLKNNICKVGSTYELNPINVKPSEIGRNQLISQLGQLLKIKYKILDHTAGIRPTTRDRRPFIGKHPNYPQIGIFSGLGTKGVSLSPYFSKQLVDFFENGKELDREVDIKRYFG